MARLGRPAHPIQSWRVLAWAARSARACSARSVSRSVDAQPSSVPAQAEPVANDTQQLPLGTQPLEAQHELELEEHDRINGRTAAQYLVQAPRFVRPPTDEERQALAAGLHSADAFTLRRSQIILASARGERAPAIARSLGCSDQTVRNAIRAFDAHGVAALTEGSSRPHTIHAAFADDTAERLRTLLHRTPRDFGHPTSIWTLDLAAEVAWTEGITTPRVSDETVRATLARLGIRWRRAKAWISSPDPAYTQKNGGVTG